MSDSEETATPAQVAFDASALALFDTLGIDTGYYNIWGEYRELSAETAGPLLAAFGIACSDGASLADAREGIDAAYWRRTIAPVVLHDQRQRDIDLTVVLDAADINKPLRWEIDTEQNAHYTGLIEGEHRRHGRQRMCEGGVRQEVIITLAPSVPLEMGYHRLRVWQQDRPQDATTLIVTPSRCHDVPASGSGPRHWGLSVQLYALRSARNWGVGDFTDLDTLIDTAARLGAAVVGINPLHALSVHQPVVPSPYSPNSRHFLNVAYLDVENIADFDECAYQLTPPQRSVLASLREREYVDHAGVIALKMPVLRALFDHFSTRHLGRNTVRAQDFTRFQTHHGERLRHFAIFEAFKHVDAGGAPGDEPARHASFDCADTEAMNAFVTAHRDDVLFFEYLQWQADLQLRACAAHVAASGMAMGLYVDLAVGCTPDSADVWSDPTLFADGIEIGAPADDFSPDGQCWGTSPWRPDVLANRAYRPFIELLRDNMRHAAVIRIDHILGLLRLFWIPRDQRPSDGAYVRYPLDHLLAITALESQRNRCVVVGEDLGNVPHEIRHALWEWGILSTRVFYFEKYYEGDHAYKIPEHYPEQALTTLGSHDLPTLRGFWEQRDLDIFSELRRFPSSQFAEDRYNDRRADRHRLLHRMHESQMAIPDIHVDKPLTPTQAAGLAIALYAWLARSPSQLLLVQPEDVFGVRDQINVPGTVDEQPNWRRKLELPVERWLEDDALARLAHTLRATRPPIA